MAFINLNLNEAKEPTPVPKGAYELQITAAQATETGENSKHPGTPMIKFTLGFTDLELNAPSFNHYMVFPYEGQTEYLNLTMLGIKRFLVHFGIPYGEEGFDTEVLADAAVGCVASCEVDQQEPNPDTGAIYNKLGFLPKIREEMSGGKGKAPARKRG